LFGLSQFHHANLCQPPSLFSTRPLKCAAARKLYKISSPISTENRNLPSRRSPKAAFGFSRNFHDAERDNFRFLAGLIFRASFAAPVCHHKTQSSKCEFQDAERETFKIERG
jgi:hypothetical protein